MPLENVQSIYTSFMNTRTNCWN